MKRYALWVFCDSWKKEDADTWEEVQAKHREMQVYASEVFVTEFIPIKIVPAKKPEMEEQKTSLCMEDR